MCMLHVHVHVHARAQHVHVHACVQHVHACVQHVHACVQHVHACVQHVHACVQHVHARLRRAAHGLHGPHILRWLSSFAPRRGQTAEQSRVSGFYGVLLTTYLVTVSITSILDTLWHTRPRRTCELHHYACTQVHPYTSTPLHLHLHASRPLHYYTASTTPLHPIAASPLHPYGCTQLPLAYGCAANGTIVTITMASSEAEGRGAALWWGPEAVAEPCVQETLATT
jgi:hypothetical protein